METVTERAPGRTLRRTARRTRRARVIRRGAVVVLKAWDPATPYLTRLRAAGLDAYSAYLDERKSFGDSPAFFLDCGDHLLGHGPQGRGRPCPHVHCRDRSRGCPPLPHRRAPPRAGGGDRPRHRPLREGAPPPSRGAPVAARLWRSPTGREPTPRRQKADRLTAAVRERTTSTPCVCSTASRWASWDGRFPEIEVTALMDLNRMAAILEADGKAKELVFIDPRLRKLLDVDVRVVMTWDTDMTDMDLWVTEPCRREVLLRPCSHHRGRHDLPRLHGRVRSRRVPGAKRLVRRLSRPGQLLRFAIPVAHRAHDSPGTRDHRLRPTAARSVSR